MAVTLETELQSLMFSSQIPDIVITTNDDNEVEVCLDCRDHTIFSALHFPYGRSVKIHDLRSVIEYYLRDRNISLDEFQLRSVTNGTQQILATFQVLYLEQHFTSDIEEFLRNNFLTTMAAKLTSPKATEFLHFFIEANAQEYITYQVVASVYGGEPRIYQMRENCGLYNHDRIKSVELTCEMLIGIVESPADIALFSRFIFLSYSKSEFSPEARQKFAELTEIRKHGCSHLTLQILRYRAKFIQEFKDSYNFCKNDINTTLADSGIEDRIMFNWYVVLAAFHALREVINLPFDYKEIRAIVIEGIKAQNKETKSNNELANFWNIVSYFHQEGKIWNGCDYRIDMEDHLKCSNRNSEMVFSQTKRILYLRYSRIFQLYKMHGRQVNEVLIPPASLIYYLENSPAYLGKKRSWRYKVIINGVEQTEERKDSTTGFTKYVKKYGFDQVMCFDYDKLNEAYDINLEDSATYDTP